MLQEVVAHGSSIDELSSRNQSLQSEKDESQSILTNIKARYDQLLTKVRVGLKDNWYQFLTYFRFRNTIHVCQFWTGKLNYIKEN